MLTRADESTDVIAYELMKNLVKIAPVYLGNGNHEQKMREYPEYYNGRYEEYIDAVEELGVHVLENDSTVIICNGTKLSIAGLEVPVKCYTHFKDIPLEMKEITSRIGSADKSVFQILMAHTPVYAEIYKKWGADLTLSGHLHGGIVRLPFIGGVITPQVKFFPRYSGDMYKDETHYSIVSRGLGTHTVNIRYLNRAELVSVVLKEK
jgi:predicted MPP superfamily phosphohydrolase